MNLQKPNISDYPTFYNTYISLVKSNDIIKEIDGQHNEITELLHSISEEKSTYAYSEGKWSIKVLLQHIIDAERIFGYRMLCIARGETISLPSFEENTYANNCHANQREWKTLVKEFLNLRTSTKDLFLSLNETEFNKSGIIYNNPITALSLAYIIVGHTKHHLNILLERYLKAT